MEHQGLKDILAMIEAGDVESARLALRPYVQGAHDAPSHEVRYVLGRAWFDADRAAARYLFEEALALDGNFAEAGQWEAKCGSALEDLEDFRDTYHPACEQCCLNFRESNPSCPYCGHVKPSQRRASGDSVEDQFRAAGQEVMDSLKSFAAREDVQKAREKAVEAGQKAYTRAKELAESEKARELRGKAEALGKKTAAKAKEFGERKEVQEALHRTQERSESFLKRAEQFIAAEQGRINAAQGAKKIWLMGRWVLAGIFLLAFLRWLAGGE